MWNFSFWSNSPSTLVTNSLCFCVLFLCFVSPTFPHNCILTTYIATIDTKIGKVGYMGHTWVSRTLTLICPIIMWELLRNFPEKSQGVLWLLAAGNGSETCDCFFTGSDPCSQGHSCQHICVNSGDSYTCKCREGYTLSTDRKTCSRMNLMFVSVAGQRMVKSPPLMLCI